MTTGQYESNIRRFLAWYKAQYGYLAMVDMELRGDRFIMASPQFQWWLSNDKPSKKVIPTAEQPTAVPTTVTPPIIPTTTPRPVGYEPTAEETARAWRIATGLEPETAAITPYQQAGLGLQQREFDWRMSQAATAAGERGQELAWKMSQAATERQDALWRAQQIAKYNVFQQENLRQQRASQTREEDIRAQERQKAGAEFEQWKATILSGVAPRDWVIREKAKAAGNPFEVQGTDVARGIENLKQGAKQAQQDVANAKASYDAVSARVTDNATIVDNAELQVAKNRYEQAVGNRNRLEGELTNIEQWNVPGRLTQEGLPGWEGSQYLGANATSMAQMTAELTPRDIGGGSFSIGGGGAFGSIPTVKPYEPQVPEDIKRYLIGGTFGGAIQPPSGQSWSVAPYSTRERLYGYAESLGLNAADLETRIQSMFPQTPTRGARWSPRM